jgi:hypothetical protein
MRFILTVLVVLGLIGFFATAGKNGPSSASSTQASVTVPVQDVSPYIERLGDSIVALTSFNAADFAGSVSTIGLALALFDTLAKLLDEGHGMTMSEETAKKRAEFVKLLKQKQKNSLPVLRDKCGPAMREFLWEHDVKARTIGAGYRTAELTGGLFAANRNIKDTQSTLYPTLMKLRFTRSQYRWFEGADEFTYYTLSPPSDDAVVIFFDNGSFREIN